MRDPYEVLQVSRSAEPEVIEAAYRRLARKYHPDTNPSPDATARMKEINWAYEVLRDPIKRRQHDADWNRYQSSVHSQTYSRPPTPTSPPARSTPPPASQPTPTFLHRYWYLIALAIAAYFLLRPTTDRGQQVALPPASELTSGGPDPYDGCIPWTSAHLYDGETKCVLGTVRIVEEEFDSASGADVWTAHFSFDPDSDFSLISVNRDISKWQGQCVAVYGTLFDRDAIRDYAHNPQPSMIDADPHDDRGFTVVAAPTDRCR